MMTGRSRGTLHVDKLEEFTKYCQSQGWVNHDLNGDYEVLRMKKGSEWLFVYTMNHMLTHYTTFGPSQDMALAFIREQRKK